MKSPVSGDFNVPYTETGLFFKGVLNCFGVCGRIAVCQKNGGTNMQEKERLNKFLSEAGVCLQKRGGPVDRGRCGDG